MPSTKARARPAPARFIPPMKALATDHVPDGGAAYWHSEIKFDGYRAIAVLNRGEVALWSRNEKPLVYPEIMPPLKKLKCTNAVLDGEIVALDQHGRSSFQTLQGRDLGERPPIVFYVFDLLQLDGASLLAEPIEARRVSLEKLVRKPDRFLQLSPIFDAEPETVFAEAKRKGLEGIILKRHGSAYESDRRSGTWLKLKNVNEQELVIGGFTPPRNSREHFGAILVGYYEDGVLRYAGKVGTGFNREALASLHGQFLRHRTERCPFANLPLDHKSRFGQSGNDARDHAHRDVAAAQARGADPVHRVDSGRAAAPARVSRAAARQTREPGAPGSDGGLTTPAMRTARFTTVVEKSGRPEVHLPLQRPEKDAALQRAIRAGRVMLIHRPDKGTAKDFGTVGFHAGPHTQILVFPKSLRRFSDRMIVGINYDLLAEAEAEKSPARARSRAPAQRTKRKSAPRRAS
jgi:DNA ligase D-like protein (predicted ligase)